MRPRRRGAHRPRPAVSPALRALAAQRLAVARCGVRARHTPAVVPVGQLAASARAGLSGVRQPPLLVALAAECRRPRLQPARPVRIIGDDKKGPGSIRREESTMPRTPNPQALAPLAEGPGGLCAPAADPRLPAPSLRLVASHPRRPTASRQRHPPSLGGPLTPAGPRQPRRARRERPGPRERRCLGPD